MKVHSLFACVVAAAPLLAQTAPPPKLDGWVFSGTADGYFTLNTNHPPSKFNQLQNFDIHDEQPELSLAKITVDKSDKVLGLHADVGLGETFRLIHSSDAAALDHKGFRYVEQMYVIVKPSHAHGAEFDFGQFVTSAGAEVIESSANWNYTRSYLFTLGTPYYHFGLRSSVPVTKELSVGFQLVNAWNTLWGNNDLDNVGLTLAWAKPKYTWSVNYYGGPNHQGTTRGKRNLIDSTILVKPTGKLSVYLNGDYIRDNRVGVGYDSWYGVAAAARYQLLNRVAVAARAEAFNDATGFTTGTRQVLKEGTATAEFKYNDHLVARAEYRRDNSDRTYFERRGMPAQRHNMNTLTVGIVLLAGLLK